MLDPRGRSCGPLDVCGACVNLSPALIADPRWSTLPSAAFRVWCFLRSQGETVVISKARIAAGVRMSTSTVDRLIRQLEDAELLEVHPAYTGPRRPGSNCYELAQWE